MSTENRDAMVFDQQCAAEDAAYQAQLDGSRDGQQVHFNGAFYVLCKVLTDGSEVFDVYVHCVHQDEAALLYGAQDETDEISRCNKLAQALA